jgi:hypothetical protein
MITPEEIKIKALRGFKSVVRASLSGENIFPLIIRGDKKSSSGNYSEQKNAILPLYEESKEVKGKGFSVQWKHRTVNGIKQQLPAQIFFADLDDYLHFTRTENDFKKIHEVAKVWVDSFPTLKLWVGANIDLVLKYADVYDDILKVLLYLSKTPPPHAHYIRELPIEVHSKFIEDHEGILKRLLDEILPPHYIDTDYSDFSQRYFLKKLPVQTSIRVLDDQFKSVLGYDECSLSLTDASFLNWVPQKVFIIENRTCFYTFPKVPGAVAVFGAGFKAKLTEHISWLDQTEIFCWFDLDVSGFEMVNMVRTRYQHAKTFLMDERTLDTFKPFIVTDQKSYKELSVLKPEEFKLVEKIRNNKWRLEQEKLSHSYIVERLNDLV